MEIPKKKSKVTIEMKEMIKTKPIVIIGIVVLLLFPDSDTAVDIQRTSTCWT